MASSMERIHIPAGYAPSLSLYETQKAIVVVKRVFQDTFSGALHLRRVSAPLFVAADSGINDDLNGVERAVTFDIPAVGIDAQVIHSLAKWKRMALRDYGFLPGRGLYTDMNAIRRDEELDNLHSIYVDQWDWEKVITREQRTVDFLKETVKAIVGAMCDTERTLRAIYPMLETRPPISRDITFLTAQELEDRYPDLTPKERENALLKEHPTVFLMGIGGKLRSGRPHDGRAPDYDDWDLNGDLLVWNDLLGCAMELSSMGIRVDEESMRRQLKLSGHEERASLPFHRDLLEGRLPLTIGGGIGQSRLCMLLLGKAHIGEVQASLWGPETCKAAREAGIPLL